MGEVLEDIDVLHARGRNAIYPWNEWFDGRVWRLHQGEDFAAHGQKFRALAYNAARDRGGRVTTSVHPDGRTVDLQFFIPSQST